jgi:hypothetical protein
MSRRRPHDAGRAPAARGPGGPARAMLTVAMAFAIYLALLPAWRWLGIDRLYRGAVLLAADLAASLAGVLHGSERLTPAAYTSFESVFLFVAALGLAATALPRRTRLRRFGALLGAVLLLNAACVALDVAIAAARGGFPVAGGRMSVPLGYVIAERVRFVLYTVGLQLWPFLAMGITALWSARAAAAPAPQRARAGRSG